MSHRKVGAALRAAGIALAAALAVAPAARSQAIDEQLLADVKVRALRPTAPNGRIVDVAIPARAP